MSRFEVRCHQCDVVFPPGTKRCFYCGGPTGDVTSGDGGPTFRELIEQGVEDGSGGASEEPTMRRGPAAEAEEEEAAQGSLPRVLSSLVWVVLLIALSVYRACAG